MKSGQSLAGSVRLACRCCGIEAPDVGFVELAQDREPDLLCDDCEAKARQLLADAAVRSMMRAVAKAKKGGFL